MSMQPTRSRKRDGHGEIRLCSLSEPFPVRWARRLRTPLGTASLAAVAFVAGVQAAAFLGYTGPGEEATARLEAQGREIERLRDDLDLYRFQAERLEEIQLYATRYGIPADLARDVYDIARTEGLDPQVAFKMVRTESGFRQYAVSEAGAVGYAQVMPSTALWLDPSITEDRLYDRRTNLRLGFRYLRMQLDRYDGELRLALLAYNRGPNRVGSLLAMGRDPSNGYARSVMGGLE